MKKLVIFIFSLVIVSLLSCTTQMKHSSSSPVKMVKDIPLSKNPDHQMIKKRLMVLPILDPKKVLPEDLSRAIKKGFLKELNRNEEVIAFDSEDLKITTPKITIQGSYDFKDLQKTLKEFSVHSGLEAQVYDLKIRKSIPQKGLLKTVKTEYECSVVVKVVNQSGKELYNTMKTVTYKDQEGSLAEEVENPSKLVGTLIKDTLYEFVPQIVKSLETVAWEGRIASVQGERLFLNVGKISGLNVGVLLRVVDEGEEIYDTETGNFIGKSPGRLKGTLEVVSFFGQDGAIAVIHSGAGFRENDRVELY